MSARATWKGVLQVSLVTIPIKVFPATESSETLSFNQLHDACQSRMQQKRWCATCAREVPNAEIVKGFEFEKGRYVILQPEELDAVQPPSTKVIDLVQFAPAAALEWRMIDRAYFLEPEPSAQDAYALLCAAMVGSVGIGQLAIYGREYLVAVSPRAHTLMLYTLHHAAELREPPYVADLSRAGGKELQLAQGVIAALSGPLALATFVDQYQTDVRRLIDAKIAGEEIVVSAPVETPPVRDLKAALEASLAAVTTTKKIPAKVATPARKRA